MDVAIRHETASDIEAIAEITLAAFQSHPCSQQTEPFIINALRKAGALTISLVAVLDNDIVGHIAFSPVVLADGTGDWYGLGPIAVRPDLQRKGIGSALTREGLDCLKKLDARGRVLVGDPNYYRRFGFKNLPGLTVPPVPDENVLALPFNDHHPHGNVTFHNAFQATE